MLLYLHRDEALQNTKEQMRKTERKQKTFFVSQRSMRPSSQRQMDSRHEIVPSEEWNMIFMGFGQKRRIGCGKQLFMAVGQQM
jgi:hypothetical protein